MSALVRRTASTLVLLAAAAGAAARGPIDPPAGPVAPTHKTLTEVEPRIPVGPATTPGDFDSTPSLYKITQPGSYYLTGNIEVPSGVVAIEISCDDVVLDLSGFTISRAGSGASTVSLIQRVAALTNTTVRNGTLRNSGKHGLELGTLARIEHVRVIGSVENGISLVGARGVVESCNVESVGGIGISVVSDSRVAGCVVYGATGDLISAGTNCDIADCRVNNSGANGINVAYGSTVHGCSARGCTQFGITSSLNSGVASIEHNTVTLCSAGGIRIYGGSHVTGNTISISGSSSPGILVVGDGNIVRDNNTSGGSDCVKIEATGDDNLVVGNLAQNPGVGNGFANVNLATNMVGPVYSTAGTISSTNPHANFSR